MKEVKYHVTQIIEAIKENKYISNTLIDALEYGIWKIDKCISNIGDAFFVFNGQSPHLEKRIK